MSEAPRAGTSAAVEVRDVVFDYPSGRALDGVSFRVERGAICALVGPNGAGKTTLLACIAALRAPFSGAIVVDGIDAVESPRECHARLGYLCDFFGLYEQLSVRQCLAHAAAMRAVPAARLDAAVDEAIARLELDEHADTRAGALSRGWRQRLGIAQAIIHRPSVLLLDEPASGLDPEARHGLAALMRRLRDDGMTLMVSSHILAELEDYTTEMLILRAGRIVDQRALAGAPGAGVRLRVRLHRPDAGLRAALDRADVSALSIDADGARFVFAGGAAERAALLARLVDAELPVCAFGEDAESMQDAYLARLAKDRRSQESQR